MSVAVFRRAEICFMLGTAASRGRGMEIGTLIEQALPPAQVRRAGPREACNGAGGRRLIALCSRPHGR